MWWNIAIVLIVLWLFGLMRSYTFGGLIHLLLVLAVVIAAIRLIRGEERP